MKWFDAGVNLLDNRLDPEAVISEAASAGVDKICLITTHPDEWEKAAALHAAFPDSLCYTVGIHPHNAKDVKQADYGRLKVCARLPGVVAIGECGLDFNRNFSPPDTQKAVFIRQLEIAAEMGLPVYLHERDAFETQQTCLKPLLHDLKGGIAHCFTGDKSTMQAYLDMGLYIGITGWVCDPKRGDALRDAVPSLPLERIVLETDAPYLFPKTLRPRKRHNSPASIPHIAEAVADLLQTTPAQISLNSYANSCRLFGLG